MNNPLLSAALAYAARGWPVFPLQPAEKKPLGTLAPRGFQDATTDVETIRGWWEIIPNANVGIRTGAVSGLIVLDIDPRHGGDEALRDLELRYGQLPDTVTALTGGGGEHLLFAYPGDGVVVRNGTKIGGLNGLDVRGEGGYIVAPPSAHPSGGVYSWEAASHPDEVAPAPIPRWLLQLLQAETPRAAHSPVDARIAEGTRNTALTSIAGTMRRAGMSQEEILAALLAVNDHRCDQPLPRKEVEGIASSVARYLPAATKTSSSKKSSQASQLVQLANAELFHSPDHEAFATVTVVDHRETWPLKSKALRRWLAQRFYQQTRTTPSAQALQDAIGVLEGRALFEGSRQSVFTRIAQHDGAIYLDRVNDRWETIKITPFGWETVTGHPVKFRRARGMAPLPEPVRGGRIEELRPFVNVAHDADFVLCVAWLIGALRPRGPYPILALHGEHDSAKSTTARVLRALIDPSTSPLRSAPREERDVLIAATNAWCLAFDNLSTLPPWLPDAFCRLSTGGGLATRELYTDADEVLFEAQRPVILNGISEVATQSDLLDRMIMLELPAIEGEARRAEDGTSSGAGSRRSGRSSSACCVTRLARRFGISPASYSGLFPGWPISPSGQLRRRRLSAGPVGLSSSPTPATAR